MTEKLSKKRYSTNLFDVTQDIIGALPLKLVEQWLSSDQTYDDALKLLATHQVQGYSVSSDSVGLTKLCQQKGLLEILAIINQPKKIVHGYGKAISGESVGIWAADNTQMFYPNSVEASTLVAALLTIQDEINRSCQIKIGLGAHYGSFYQISGGLYGTEANAIEEVAESHTEGGEILISQAICDRLPVQHNFTLERRDDLPQNLTAEIGNIYRVLDGARLEDLRPSDQRYPIPYSEDFYANLLEYETRLEDHDFAHYLTDKYMQQKVVVLIESKSEVADIHEITMFNQLSFSALMKDIGLRLIAPELEAEIKVVSSLGIYAFDQAIAALNFAQTFRQELAKQDLTCRIGLDQGEVLIFNLAIGTRDIAGSPVNVASKMAQDRGEFGKLYLSAAVRDLLVRDAVEVSKFREIKYQVSGVEITAYEG
ncbi:family 3 adenylate cyclase [Pseudanabaena sp. FACHB-1998]|uniref:adenylate/guanylate cyclase domain-containing protein n=1 Tax=Pseudanabaena sp. FACHB-1998 TaxID=2692858 RepID=UPI00168149BD|nr:adenylate/guanylate cyclase domain-containing protein [Pseudanabaena sp. FACHB-1998]MBD2177013.1 family 3 adenylate cyclase [Pseudanabaena sp. FACHB-1998]